MWVRSLGREDPLEKEMATHSSILAWEIPWTEEPGRLQSVRAAESDTTEVPLTRTKGTTHDLSASGFFLPACFQSSSALCQSFTPFVSELTSRRTHGPRRVCALVCDGRVAPRPGDSDYAAVGVRVQHVRVRVQHPPESLLPNPSGAHLQGELLGHMASPYLPY